MSTVYVKQHDTKAIFTDTLMVNDLPVNLTGTTIRFLMRKPVGALVDGVATITNPVAGTVAYQPVAADVAIVGKYRQEWEVTFGDGKVLTFPNDTYNFVLIERDVGAVNGSGGGGGGPPGGGTGDLTVDSESGLSVVGGVGAVNGTGTLVALRKADATQSGYLSSEDWSAFSTGGASEVDDTAYDAATWNGDTTHAPSRNAVRDKFESLGGGGILSVPDGKKIFVSKSGTDATGTRGDVAKPFLTIAAATLATGITAGDVIVVGPGTFTENSGVELPDNVSLVGMGRNITRIESTLLGTTAPFHGIVAPGNNSVISDIGMVAISPTGTGNEHVNPISRRAGATKSWTNVLVRDCYLYGLADVIMANGASLGDMRFEHCFLEGKNDIVMWQSASNGVFVDCEFKHTTVSGQENLTAIGIYDGGSGGTVKAYGCRFVLAGFNMTGQASPIAADSHVEIYDFVIDYANFTVAAASRDLNAWSPGALFVSNVRKINAGGAALTYYATNAPIEVSDMQAGRVVASLPASPQQGQTATVTDGAASLAYGATVVGGGSTKYYVWYDGTNWKVVGGGDVITASSTTTFSNKRIVPRVTLITSSATPAINTDSCDCVTITALAVAITSMTTSLSGTPNNFDHLEIRFKDNGTGRAIAWGTSYESGQATLPTTTIANKVTRVGLEWDSVKSKWVCLATDQEP